MHSLRTRLIAAFVIATSLPLAATIWITMSLLERSLGYATTEELDRLSRTLEETVGSSISASARRSDRTPRWDGPRRRRMASRPSAPGPKTFEAFWESGEPERFGLSGPGGDHLDFMRARRSGVEVYARDLGGIQMQELSDEAAAGARSSSARSRRAICAAASR